MLCLLETQEMQPHEWTSGEIKRRVHFSLGLSFDRLLALYFVECGEIAERQGDM